MPDLQSQLWELQRQEVRRNFLAAVGGDEAKAANAMRDYLAGVYFSSQDIDAMSFDELVSTIAKMDPDNVDAYIKLLELEKPTLESEEN